MAVAARQVAASSIILLAENVVRLAAVAAVSFWIARHLGPSQFGVLNVASALMTIMLSVAALGMEVPVILRLTRTTRPGAIMGTVLTIRSAVSIFVFFLVLLLAYGMKRDDVTAVEVTIIVSLGILAGVANALDFWFKARTSAGVPALARTAATLISACAKVFCLLLGFGVVALAWTVVWEAVLAAIGLSWGFRWSARNSLPDKLSFDKKLLVPLLRESMPYFFSSVAMVIYLKIDVVMLGYLSTNAQTGVYSLAQKLSEVIYVVPVVLLGSAYPFLVKRFLDGSQLGRDPMQMLFDLAVGGSMAAVVAANLVAAPVIDLVYGPAYEPSVRIFYLHSWSCIAIAMNEVRNRWLATVSLQGHAPTVAAIGLAVNLSLNLVLIPRFGAFGAAIATLVSYFISGYFSSFFIKPLRVFGYAQTRALWPWGRLFHAARLWQKGEQLA